MSGVFSSNTLYFHKLKLKLKWTYQSFGSTVCTNTFGIFVVLFPSLGQTHLHLTSSYWACDETFKIARVVSSWHDDSVRVSEQLHENTSLLDCSVSIYCVPSIYRENYLRSQLILPQKLVWNKPTKKALQYNRSSKRSWCSCSLVIHPPSWNLLPQLMMGIMEFENHSGHSVNNLTKLFCYRR